MSQRTLITGGAGFVGTNLANRLLRNGDGVVVLDDMSRPGVGANLDWLVAQHGRKLVVVEGDVRDRDVVRQALKGIDQVFHLAAQVAVTTSLSEPRHDFDVNLGGTLNLLEEVRRMRQPPPLLFTSTNKVYGSLDDIELARAGGRYQPVQTEARVHGIGEARPLSFCSPYGCSKGGADQYVLDYAKSFDLPTVVFRMSCIYGPHQQGNEDQGWVAHFFRQAMSGRPITIYGDGRQVRDVLFVEDLLDAMLLATARIGSLRGRAFNIGGGPASTVSLLELVDVIRESGAAGAGVAFARWRVGDQRWYVSDTRRFTDVTGWSPRTRLRRGLQHLQAWLQSGERRPTLAEVG